MGYQRNEGHEVAQCLLNLLQEIEGNSSDLWDLVIGLEIYTIDTMDHDEYMRTKKALKKMIKMAGKAIKAIPSRETYYNEMEEK